MKRSRWRGAGGEEQAKRSRWRGAGGEEADEEEQVKKISKIFQKLTNLFDNVKRTFPY